MASEFDLAMIHYREQKPEHKFETLEKELKSRSIPWSASKHNFAKAKELIDVLYSD